MDMIKRTQNKELRIISFKGRAKLSDPPLYQLQNLKITKNHDIE